jgi:EAL domain-containing protein (putative c-di-GMP-specific phosphodiesterase class I)
MLQALECDLGQGYLFSRPISAEAAEAMIANGAVGERLLEERTVRAG